MIKNLFAAMDGDRVLYTIGVYKDHAFRVYPDGHIKKANKQEQELTIRFSRN